MSTSTTVDDLISFVETQLETEWNCAKSAGHGFGHRSLFEERNAGWTDLDLSDNCRPSYDVRFLKVFSPERVLAEVAATRALIAALRQARAEGYDNAAHYLIEALQHRAVVWADRRGYQEIWRP